MQHLSLHMLATAIFTGLYKPLCTVKTLSIKLHYQHSCISGASVLRHLSVETIILVRFAYNLKSLTRPKRGLLKLPFLFLPKGLSTLVVEVLE